MKRVKIIFYSKVKQLLRLLDPIFDIRKLIFGLPNYILFLKDFMIYRKTEKSFSVSILDIYPQIHDKTKNTGFDRHYIYHTAWAARIVNKIKPRYHVDISSSLFFCSIISSFIPVKFYDFRPAILELSNLTTEKADLTKLHFEDNSIESLSCMHTIEHIGLGRYGDKLDSEGYIKAISELKRVLAIGGNLLFVVPIGIPKIMFNAHRIFSFTQIIDFFKYFELINFSLVPDDKNLGFISNATKEIADIQTYGCGCFWFKKKAPK